MTWNLTRRSEFQIWWVPQRPTAFKNKISNESPVGHALLGRKVGDIVDVETQAGDDPV